MMITMISTMMVLMVVSLRVGHVTLPISWRAWRRNSRGGVRAMVSTRPYPRGWQEWRVSKPPTSGFGDRRSTN